jgi:SAM-dependent methyltransferase
MNAGRRPALRQRLLLAGFELLYSRLAALHEPAGRLGIGPAWSGRRRLVLPHAPVEGIALDIGCGEGRLLAAAGQRGLNAVGADPSPAMTRRARRRGCAVIQADARRLPLAAGSAALVMCTYPGPWIADTHVWEELARVTVPGAPVRILLGGTIERGRGARLRGWLGRLVYGRPARASEFRLPATFGHPLIPGSLHEFADQWGTALLWEGERIA